VAIQTINSNSVQPLGEPNSGTGTEMGDTWNSAVTKLNAMFTDLYSGAGKVLTPGSTAAAMTASGTIDLSTIGSYSLAAPAVAGQRVDIIFRSTQGSTTDGTGNINLTAVGATFDGLNVVARATAATVPNKYLSLVAESTARWSVTSNVGLTGTLGLATA
jgi:hypothetical protein